MAWEQQRTFESSGSPNDIHFDPSNNYIAIAGASGLEVWDFETGTSVYTHDSLATYGMVRFSPDGSRLSFGASPHWVYHVDVASWTELTNASHETRNLYSEADYSPDGQLFAHQFGGQVRVLNVDGDASWSAHQTFTTNSSDKRGLCWSNHGYILATDRSGNYWVIDDTAWTITDSGTFSGTVNSYQVESHPSEPWFIIGDYDSGGVTTVAEVDDSGNLNELTTFSGTGSSDCAAVIANGYLFHSIGEGAGGEVRLADNDTWGLETTIPTPDDAIRAKFSHGGQWLAVCDRPNSQVLVYDTAVPQDTPTTPVLVSGSVSATGTSSGAGTRTHPLSGTLNTSTTAGGSAIRPRAVSSALSTISTLTGPSTRTQPASGSLSGGAAIDAQLLATPMTTVSGAISATSATHATPAVGTTPIQTAFGEGGFGSGVFGGEATITISGALSATGDTHASSTVTHRIDAAGTVQTTGQASATPVRDQLATAPLTTTAETTALSTRTRGTSAGLETTGTTDALSIRTRETSAGLETTGSTDALSIRTRDISSDLEATGITSTLSTRMREAAGNLDSTGDTTTTPLRARTSVGSLQSDAETAAVGIRSRSADATVTATGETGALGTRARTTAAHLEPTTHVASTAGRDRLATGHLETRPFIQGHAGELTYYLLAGTLQPTTDAGAEAGRDRRTAVHVQSAGDTHARSTRARTTTGTLATTSESGAILARNRLLTGQLETHPVIQGRIGDLTFYQLRGRLGATTALETTDSAIRDRLSSGALQSTSEADATVARLYGLIPSDVLTASGASTALTTRTRPATGQFETDAVTDALSTRTRASAGDLDGTAALAGSFGRDRRILGSLETTATLRSSAGELATYLLVGALQSHTEATADAARSRTTAAHAQTTASVASALVLTAPLAGHLYTTTVSAARSTRARISEGVLESTGTLTTDPLAVVRERGATGVLDPTALLDSTPTRHRRTTGALTASGSIDLVITGDRLVRAITRTLPYESTAETRLVPHDIEREVRTAAYNRDRDERAAVYDPTADTRDVPVDFVHPRLLTLIADPNPADD